MNTYTLDAESGIGLALEKLEDLGVLLDDITVTYFEAYNPIEGGGRVSIAAEYERYGSFMRLAMVCFSDIVDVLEKTDARKTLKAKSE